MRLFIAFCFDERTKDALTAVQRRLSDCASGRFTERENLHLTLAFLGEVGGDAAARRTIDERFCAPVRLEFDRIGTFRRDLYWVGVKPDPILDALYAGLVADLRRAGLSGDWHERLTPHITLGREVRVREQPDLAFEPFAMTARRLSLMKSERIAGRLTYTEIFGKSAQ